MERGSGGTLDKRKKKKRSYDIYDTNLFLYNSLGRIPRSQDNEINGCSRDKIQSSKSTNQTAKSVFHRFAKQSSTTSDEVQLELSKVCLFDEIFVVIAHLMASSSL